MDAFDIELFTKMLRRKYPKYVQEKNIQELEDRWLMNDMGRAFSTAAVMCKQIPDSVKTDEFHRGIEAIQQSTACPRLRFRSPSNEKRFNGPLPAITKKSPLADEGFTNMDLKDQIKELQDENKTLHYRIADEGLTVKDLKDHITDLIDENELLIDSWEALEYYVEVLEIGICEKNWESIHCIQNLDPISPIFQRLQYMADSVEKMFNRIDKQKAHDHLYEDYVKYKDRFLEISYEFETLKRQHRARGYKLQRCQKKMTRQLNLCLKLRGFEEEDVRFHHETSTPQSNDEKTNELRERISKLQCELETRNLQVIKATKRSHKGDKKVEELEDQLQTKEEETKQQAEKIRHLKMELDDFQKGFNGVDKIKVCELTKKNEGLVEDNSGPNNRLLELLNNNTDLKREMQDLEEQNRLIQNRLDDQANVSSQNNDLKTNVNMLLHEISESDQRNNELKTKLEHLKQELKQVRSEIDEKKTHIQDLEKKFDDKASNSRNRNESDGTHLITLRHEQSKAGKRLLELLNNNSDLKREMQDLEEQNTQIQNRNSQLERQYHLQKQELQQVRSEVADKEKEIRNLRTKNNELKSQHEHLHQELKQVRSEIAEKEKRIQDLRKESDDAARTSRKRNESDEALCVKIQHEKAEAGKSITQLQSMIERHTQELQRISSDLKTSEEQNRSAKKRLQNKEEENKTQAEQIRHLKKERDDFQKGFNGVDEIIVSQLTEKNEILEEDNSGLNNRLLQLRNENSVLKQEMKDLKEQNGLIQNRFDDEASTFRKRNESDEAHFITLQHEKSEAGNSNTQLQTMIERQNQELQRLSSDLKESEEENRSAKKRTKIFQTEKTNIIQIETKMRQYEKENDRLKQSYAKLEKDADRLRNELQRTETELRLSKENYEDIQKRLNTTGKNSQRLEELEGMLGASKKEKHDLKESNTKLHKDAERLQNQLQRTKTELRLAREKDDDLQNRPNNTDNNSQRLEELEGMLGVSRKEKQDLEESYANLQKNAERLQNQFQRTKTELRLAQEKNEDLQNRFSKVAAAQLTHDNPNIADLSDKNRPTKLAEAFSELYDNEWTEAYSAFEDDPQNTTTEEDIVKNLRNILLNCFRQCTDISTTQIQSIKALLLSPSAGSSMTRSKQELSTEQAKAVNDLRKQTTSAAIESVKQVMARQYAESRKYPSLKIFIEKCAELCWLMVVQSPPVFIDDRHQSDNRFDKDIFKAYTKGGSVIDYVVWPPVYLHHGGPLLCKGTAQGKR